MISGIRNKAEIPLYGLVLAGGRSLRMGHDKGAIQWHGKEQRFYMADMLHGLCDNVFISCRADQQHEIALPYRSLLDSYPGSGPIVAILSAFTAHPGVAWLVVACDLPLMTTGTLQLLISNRDNTMMATTFSSPFDQLPEPLITIWEPSGYQLLLAHVAEGYKCPRKALINNAPIVKVIAAEQPDTLLNTNTPGDAEKARNLLLVR